MPRLNPAVDDALGAHDLARVIAVCDRFEAEWNAGRPRRIEDEIVAKDEAIRDRLFRELVALEVELERRDGRRAEIGTYLSRFPDQALVIREVFIEPAGTVCYPEATDPGPPIEKASSQEGYELLRKLGQGGQATAYLARDRALQRLVVLKRYHAVASSGRREAVLTEGRALARVRSPFVAPCYGVETSGDLVDLIVEYVPGRPLTKLTADELADTARSARLIDQVAGGLAEVHACGLVHRDIKPQNIILGDDGVPRLVDFGLAVPVASEALHDVSGSPPFMAPEQARGQGERVDARTDVYGLGAVLYFLLTGKPPHDGDTFVAILEQAREAPVVPPRHINRHVHLRARAAWNASEALASDSAGAQLTRRPTRLRRSVAALSADAAGRAGARSHRPLAGALRVGVGVLAGTEAAATARHRSRDRAPSGHGRATRAQAGDRGGPAGDPLRDPPFPQARREELQREGSRPSG